jgi:hypothetical protein
MFEEELARRAGESRQQLDQIARGAFQCVPPGREQVERQGHARQEVCRQPIRVDQRADLAIGSLAPGGMGDLGREEIAASPARRFGNPAAEFAALAILAEMAADRQAPLCAPGAWSMRAADRNRVSSGSWTLCFLRTLAGMSGSGIVTLSK